MSLWLGLQREVSLSPERASVRSAHAGWTFSPPPHPSSQRTGWRSDARQCLTWSVLAAFQSPYQRHIVVVQYFMVMEG